MKINKLPYYQTSTWTCESVRVTSQVFLMHSSLLKKIRPSPNTHLYFQTLFTSHKIWGRASSKMITCLIKQTKEGAYFLWKRAKDCENRDLWATDGSSWTLWSAKPEEMQMTGEMSAHQEQPLLLLPTMQSDVPDCARLEHGKGPRGEKSCRKERLTMCDPEASCHFTAKNAFSSLFSRQISIVLLTTEEAF